MGHPQRMPRLASLPSILGALPFRGSDAVAAGILTAFVLRGPNWQRLLPDVYVHRTVYRPDDHRMWCEAVALSLRGGSCLGGWSAAFIHGLDVLPRDAQVWVNVPIAVRVRPRDHVLIKRTPLAFDDIITRSDLLITSAVRTAFDLARHLDRPDALAALDAHCHQLVSRTDLATYAARRWDWPGTRQLRELLPLVEPRTESPTESRLRLQLHDAGAPRPVAQYVIRTATGAFLGRADLAYPDWRIAIEYEGDHHRETEQFRRDVQRQTALEEEGWLVLRVTADDLFRHPQRLTRRILRAIASRRTTGTPPA